MRQSRRPWDLDVRRVDVPERQVGFLERWHQLRRHALGDHRMIVGVWIRYRPIDQLAAAALREAAHELGDLWAPIEIAGDGHVNSRQAGSYAA